MDEDLAPLLISDNQLNKELINSGDQLGGLGTPAEIFGSPKGSPKFSLEHSLGIEVDQLGDTLSYSVIEKTKAHFAQYGVPATSATLITVHNS